MTKAEPSIIISLLIGFSMSLIALITALGNMIVLLAFYCDKKLRTINDYFILNMAIADFLVGFFCIPFYIPFSLTQSWPFGRLFCQIWVTIDDVATMASVINIVAISINRYWSIAYPISYRKYVRQHFVYLVMAGVWCLSFLNFAPGIWLLSLFENERNQTNGECSGDYNNSFVYMLIAQFNYFIWPFIVLCVLNMLIMLNIWQRSRKMSRMMLPKEHLKRKRVDGSTTIGGNRDIQDDQPLSILSKHNQSMITEQNLHILKRSYPNKEFSQHFSKKQHTMTSFSSLINPNSLHKVNSPKCRDVRKTTRQTFSPVVPSQKNFHVNNSATDHRCPSASPDESEIEMSKAVGTETISMKTNCQIHRQGQSRIVRDQKAARSLFILVIVFLIFLFPYVICATASTAGAKISPLVFEISFWLLWLNSTCNPFLYPFIQLKYRRAYLKLFHSCKQCLCCFGTNHSI